MLAILSGPPPRPFGCVAISRLRGGRRIDHRYSQAPCQGPVGGATNAGRSESSRASLRSTCLGTSVRSCRRGGFFAPNRGESASPLRGPRRPPRKLLRGCRERLPVAGLRRGAARGRGVVDLRGARFGRSFGLCATLRPTGLGVCTAATPRLSTAISFADSRCFAPERTLLPRHVEAVEEQGDERDGVRRERESHGGPSDARRAARARSPSSWKRRQVR